MRCALVHSETRAVINVIVADPARDKAPEGCELALVPIDCAAGEGWLYSVDRGFIMGPELKAKADDERRAAWNHPDAVLIRQIEASPDAVLDAMEADNG